MPPRQQQRSPQAHRAASAIPFTAAAHEHTEPVTTQAVTPGAAAVQLGPFDVPAYGFLRHLCIEVQFSGGTLGAGVFHADAPWNLFTQLALYDVNGAPIFGPLDGFASMWANIVGGYAFRQDPRLDPSYASGINSKFMLRIPVEIAHHSGLGSLANQNAAASYKLAFTVNQLTGTNGLFTTAPTTAPLVTIKVWLEAWSLPNPTDIAGRIQAQTPPQHGTTQYWSYFNKATAAGNQTLLFPRVGNLIRNFLFISRDASGVRSDAVFPDPVQIQWDARSLLNHSQFYQIQNQMQSYVSGVTRDTGVFFLNYNDLVAGHAGDEEANFWLPTVQSTRFELDGVSTAAGSIQVVTNDIAPVEVTPQERFVETSDTGFHPNVGQPVPAAQ